MLSKGKFEKQQTGRFQSCSRYRNSQLVLTPIDEALQMKKSLDSYMYRVAKEVSI